MAGSRSGDVGVSIPICAPTTVCTSCTTTKARPIITSYRQRCAVSRTCFSRPVDCQRTPSFPQHPKIRIRHGRRLVLTFSRFLFFPPLSSVSSSFLFTHYSSLFLLLLTADFSPHFSVCDGVPSAPFDPTPPFPSHPNPYQTPTKKTTKKKKTGILPLPMPRDRW
jgi:hypothetical protein